MPSVPSATLRDNLTEVKKVLKTGNKTLILTATVARLYVAYPDQNAWTYTNIMGATALVKDHSKNSFFFKIVDLMGDRGIIWEQELYNDFKYTEELPFFHTFALDECLAAFSFANEQEAKNFYKKVIKREKISKSKKSQKENKNSGGGIFGIGKSKKKKGINKSDIGNPTEFRHLGHIGFDEKKGFDIQNINPEWNDFIDQLGNYGVSKEELAQNADLINNFIEKNKKELRKANAKKSKGPPPAPASRTPTTRRAAPQPPKKQKPPPPPARKSIFSTTAPITDTQPSSPQFGAKNSVSPPVSPKTSSTPVPPPPPPPPSISAPSLQPPPIPLTFPSRSAPQQTVVAPTPPPPPARPPTSNNAPPPIPPARVTNSSPAPPPLPQTRNPNVNAAPQPPPSTGGPPPPPPPPPPPSSGGPPPPPPLPAAVSREAPPATDARTNLMESIRSRGGFSGVGLKSVGEPVRQSTFTEEPSSPTGDDNNLAKTLADALKKLNKDMGSDDSDLDDDDEWDTD